MSKTKQYPCLICEVHIKKSETCVQCYLCEEYTHPDCSNINKTFLDYLCAEQKEGNNFLWSCKKCDKVAKTLDKRVKALSKEITDMKKTITSMQNQHEDLSKEVNTVNEKCEKNKQNISENNVLTKNAIFAELREREERKGNVVIFGVPEAGPRVTQAMDKKAHDCEWICDIASAVGIRMNNNDMKFIKRLGDKSGSDEPRPTLLGLRNVDMKKDLVNSSRHLKNDRDFGDIYIVPDLTQQQREEEVELGREAHRRNADLDTESALNMEWKVVGIKGEKRLVLGQRWLREGGGGSVRGRGMPRGRGRGGHGAGRMDMARGGGIGRGGNMVRGGEVVRGRGGGGKRGRTPESDTMVKRTRPSVVEVEEGMGVVEGVVEEEEGAVTEEVLGAQEEG